MKKRTPKPKAVRPSDRQLKDTLERILELRAHGSATPEWRGFEPYLLGAEIMLGFVLGHANHMEGWIATCEKAVRELHANQAGIAAGADCKCGVCRREVAA
jgi:hypothetical protein